MGFEPEIVTLLEGDPDAPYYWKLTAPLTWTGTFEGEKGELVVEATTEKPFITDLASVPRFLTWLFPRYGTYTKAAVLHDYLCQNIGTKDHTGAPKPKVGITCTPAGSKAEPRYLTLHDRSDADEMFRATMRELGVPGGRRWMMWGAVAWATLTKSLWYGRQGRGRLRIIGFLIAAFGVAAGGSLFWLVKDHLVLALLLGTMVVGSGVMMAGYVAQGRWDRWRIYLVALGLTALFLPFLAAGLVAFVLTLVYMFVEGLVSLFAPTRKRRAARQAPVEGGRPPPAAQRIQALKSS